MNLNDINVDVTLSAEQKTEITTAASALDDALIWLISLAPVNRKRMLRLGPKSQAFVQEAVSVARDYTGLLPMGMRIEDLDRDVEIRDVLLPIQQKLESLLQRVKDTRAVAGSDLMKTATLVYRNLQSHGHTVGLDAVTASLGRRWEKQPAIGEPEEATPTAPAIQI